MGGGASGAARNINNPPRPKRLAACTTCSLHLQVSFLIYQLLLLRSVGGLGWVL